MNIKKISELAKLADLPEFVFSIPSLSFDEKLYLDWTISNNYRKNHDLYYESDMPRQTVNGTILCESIALDIQDVTIQCH